MIEFASPPSEAMLEAPCVGREPAFKGVMRFRCRLASVRELEFRSGHPAESGTPCHLDWLMGVGGRERMPMKRAADRNADFGDVTITVR